MNPSETDVYGAVKVGERGQAVIPSDARKKLGIRSGDFLLVIGTPSKDGVVLIKAEVVREMIRKMNLGVSNLDELKRHRRRG